jgi:D-glycero-D-manno-heptose 1,7-bisphosphate phosphatase
LWRCPPGNFRRANVIGTRVGGLQYSIADGSTGLLVPPNDHEALATAIGALRADPRFARELGKAGLERARRHFTWAGVAGQLAGVYAMVAARVPEVISMVMPPGDSSPERHRNAHRAARACAPAPAVFLDKDGTLVEDVPYNIDPALVRFTPHATAALRLWRDAGFRLVVVTNQAGLGLGRFDRGSLSLLHESLGDRLAQAGVPLDGIFACPHRADAGCQCRKPLPGLIVHAAATLNIDLGRSWMIGDILNDVEAGHRAGCRTILLDVGHETEWADGEGRTPAYRCADLLQAAQLILGSPEAMSPVGHRPALAQVGA